MKIPELFYGSPSQVKKRTAALAKRIVKEDAFELLTVEPMIDTSTVGGLILVNPGIGFPSDTDFQCHTLTTALMMACLPRPVHEFLERWMNWCLEEAWRFLFIIGRDGIAAFRNRPPADALALMRRYVDAGVRHFSELTAEGPRFGPAVGGPGDLWNVWGTMWYALGQLGVPKELIDAPPGRGPAELVNYIASSGSKRE